METIIVKIWSESLKNFENSKKILNLIKDISKKIKEWNHVLLVTSGAVQFWREYSNQLENKQVLAAIGWPHLINAYTNKFLQEGIGVASFLVTHADIEDYQERAQTFIETIQATWKAGLLPIVNENDPISTEEMREVGRWADNDKNALLLAKLFHAKKIILITNTDGVYSDFTDQNSRIQNIQHTKLTDEYISILCNGKSINGTGGMASKLNVGYAAWELGINTHICDWIHSWIYNNEFRWTNIIPYL